MEQTTNENISPNSFDGKKDIIMKKLSNMLVNYMSLNTSLEEKLQILQKENKLLRTTLQKLLENSLKSDTY